MLKIHPIEEFKMQNSSPRTDPMGSSIIYNDSGYFTHINPDHQSFSSNSNSNPFVFEVTEEMQELQSQGEVLATLHENQSIYFCENTVFDEPNLENSTGLWNSSLDTFEQFSNLIKYSIEGSSENYLTNMRDNSQSEYLLPQDSLSNTNQSYPVVDMEDTESEQVIIDDNTESQFSLEITNDTTRTMNENSSLSFINESSQIECNNENSLSQSTQELRTPSKTYKNVINPDLSPELFSESESELEDSFEIEQIETPRITLQTQSSKALLQRNFSQSEELLKSDRKLIRHVQESLNGVPPPPSVTILQISVTEMLDKIRDNEHLFIKPNDVLNSNLDNNTSNKEEKSVKSLLIRHSKEDFKAKEWPDILHFRFHGLHHNRSKESENFEQYCTKYATRYVGAETASSCTIWSMSDPISPSKRRIARLRRGIKSPGRRLSHLAKRRITFSSSNLQAGGSTISVLGNTSMSRQLMIDTRKMKRRSPRKSPWKSPRKSPQKRIRTPNKSAQKRLARRLNLDDESKPGCSKFSSTKRALFQSPETNRSTVSSSDVTTQFLQRSKPKRTLFTSPVKKSPAKTSNCDKKRKRDHEDCHPNKFPKSLSFDVSQPTSSTRDVSLSRSNSEFISRPSSSNGELSHLHKKKLLWAVSEALRTHQIGMSHPKFRQYATLLCKVVKDLVPDLLSNGPRQPGSTSDRMLRIARQHSYAVTRGKTFEEIMQQVKETTENLKNSKPPTGYVPLDFAKSAPIKNVLQDKILNVESNNSKTKSPSESRNQSLIADENKLRSIRRQIIFDDTEITKSFNTNR